MKNILRTKSRFIISSVAMGLGVLLFTICLQLGNSLYSEVREEIGLDEPRFDFYIYLNELDAGDIQEQLMDSGNFSYSTYSGQLSEWNCQEMCSWRIPKILDSQISGNVRSELL